MYTLLTPASDSESSPVGPMFKSRKDVTAPVTQNHYMTFPIYQLSSQVGVIQVTSQAVFSLVDRSLFELLSTAVQTKLDEILC